ncbi:MAG TPA: agmatinase [Candidatus Hydrogenedens sp.]|nr:agmatinase [Candidatus Hydrogenedens sp.]HOK08902.1 agmatinase [Candidatus Hydrogenedens sp.]
MNRSGKTYLSEKENFMALSQNFSHSDTANVIVLPVPFEKTSTFGKGSKKGPEAIINASHEVELYDTVLGYEPYKTCGGIATLCPLRTTSISGSNLAKTLEKEVSYWLNKKKYIVTLGGEHSSIVGSVYAHITTYKPLTIIQLDAHSDLRDAYLNDKWNHACAMARILDRHNEKLIQVGIRSEAPEEPEILKQEKNRVFTFYAHKLKEREKISIKEIVDLSDEQVYITLDCDVFDPSIIPSTGTPEPGGLTWEWINHFFSVLSKERKIVGFDVSELSPIPFLHHPQFTIAKLIYRLIGLIFPPKK